MKDTADSLKLPSKIHGPEIPHLVGLDVARVVAGLGVIWYHSANMYNNLGFFRMPFFTALLAFLVVEGMIYHPRRTFGDFFRSRVMRLLLPFAIWLVLYRVPNILGGHLVMPLTWDNLGVGLGASHLWYLPFAFCASLAAYAISLAMIGCSSKARTTFAGVLLAAGMAGALACLQDFRTGETLLRWSGVWSSILLGVGVAFLYLSAPVRALVRRGVWTWVVLWAALATASLMTAGSVSNACGALSGLFLLLTGLSLPAVRWPELWRYLANLAYGAFLTHFAFFLLLQRIGFKGDALGIARFVIVVAGAFSSAELLQSFPLGRVALGMKREESPVRLPASQPRVAATTAA